MRDRYGEPANGDDEPETLDQADLDIRMGPTPFGHAWIAHIRQQLKEKTDTPSRSQALASAPGGTQESEQPA